MESIKGYSGVMGRSYRVIYPDKEKVKPLEILDNNFNDSEQNITSNVASYFPVVSVFLVCVLVFYSLLKLKNFIVKAK
jgi:hypothetical protein